jgi:hypothetical protein
MARETREGLYQGVIEQDADGNYFCGPLLLDYKLAKYSFKLGDRISVKKVVSNTSAKSAEKYPQKAVKFSLAVADHS